jgi:hypothetical protein
MKFKLQMTLEAKSQLQSIMGNKSRLGLQKQIKKCLGLLSQNPRHPGLNSHPLIGSEESTGIKIWTSYVQNKTPSAHRILWTYSKSKSEIIILQIIPHY